MAERPAVRRVLVANRGEIACRIIRTLTRMGIGSVAVHSDADAGAPHVRMADAAQRLGPAPAAESYLRADLLIDAALAHGADAVHPGYGFLSEDPAFAEAVEDAGLAFCGPTPGQIRAFGRKDSARDLARAAGLPLLPGSGVLEGPDDALRAAAGIGYPVMVKSTTGGGGIGMSVCAGPDQLVVALERVARLGEASFGGSGAFLERHVARARHVEVQVLGDGRGGVVALGDRDCSVQRRHQKVLEESPAPGLGDALRARLHADAVRLAALVAYRSAGTIEFLLDADTGEAWFLEVNTRLQVEHGVTEEVLGVDLVEEMVRIASGGHDLARFAGAAPRGHAIEARVYAEDPARDHRPSSGLLTHVRFPEGVRVDGWVEDGTEVTPHYDPLLAKIVVHGRDRAEALEGLGRALAATELFGLETNLELLRAVVARGAFAQGAPTTAVLSELALAPASVEVLAPGLITTLQDHPGRLGLWAVGVPPSGPMDDRAHRLANRALGNPEGAVALEMTRIGPTLRFDRDARICLAGARMEADLDGAPVPWWAALRVRRGQTLRLGAVEGPGARAYLAVGGGFAVPPYLGSASTFTLGGFGGHCGRALRSGDILRLEPDEWPPGDAAGAAVADPPRITSDWEIEVHYGPHAAPDFFTAEYIDAFLAASWSVHHNSDRTGVRLLGPRPGWVRSDGGDAGLHPSNIHDCAYAVGAVDFTGDMPVVLGPDGPSLGGFVCPVTVATGDLWKLGQLSAGDAVRFRLARRASSRPHTDGTSAAVLERRSSGAGLPEVVVRRSGDANLLVEFGPPVLDIAVRLRVHALMSALERRGIPGVIDLTPGIRSLQVHVDPARLPLARALEVVLEEEAGLADAGDIEVPSRIVNMPLSWEDDAALLAVERYMSSVRPDAPWCPSNTEFIRRVNGLGSVDEVREIVFGADYLVLGLGDVYLGAPVATPVDPRHRLVTTKYNPARTWTPENAVGIGGAYMCVYGMEGPGRVPARGPDRPGVEHVPLDAGLPPGYALAPALLRPDPLLPGDLGRARGVAPGRARRHPAARHPRRRILAGRPRGLPGPDPPGGRGVPRAPARRLPRRARALGGAGPVGGPGPRPRPRPAPVTGTGSVASRSRRTSRPTSGRSWSVRATWCGPARWWRCWRR